MSQALKGILERKLSDGVFGDTTTGADWCVKALHPSDPLTEVRGIPDQSSVPTVCMNYQSTFTLRTTSTNTWSFDMTMLPHPYYFAFWQGNDGGVFCPESVDTLEGNMWNTQIIQGGGMPTSDQLLSTWLGLAQRWRLVYAGVTVYQDGPDLANQGTIVVAQTPLVAPTTYLVHTTGAVSEQTVGVKYYSQPILGPSFSRSQNMPNAMLGRSRDGAYVPLKLTETCQDWYGPETIIGVVSGVSSTVGQSVTVIIPTTYTPNYPFPAVHSTTYNLGPPASLAGAAVVDLISSNCAQISARNLSPQTSYTFFFRYGLELQMAPSSALTPQLKLSPPYDPKAMITYFMLNREMKDAYPADYNDLGKMWDVISGAVKTLAPALNLVVPGLGPVARSVTGFGDAIRTRRQNRKKGIRNADQNKAAMEDMIRDTPQMAKDAAATLQNVRMLRNSRRRRRQRKAVAVK